MYFMYVRKGNNTESIKIGTCDLIQYIKYATCILLFYEQGNNNK